MDIKYCSYCQKLWKEEDCITGQTYVGEAWGHPIYEDYISCPECSNNVNDWEGEPYIYDEYGDLYEGDEDEEENDS